jgi:hydrogenase maturation protease
MILVAGIGNMLLGDDGFGVEVVRRLGARARAGVRVVDFGIRGLDLAYALLEPWDAVVLIDAARGQRAPGTLWVVEPQVGDSDAGLELHGVDPVRVLQTARALGAPPTPLRVVCCEPATVVEDDDSLSMELSAQVAAAVDPAVALVESLIAELAHA